MGYYIPTRRKRTDADREALRVAAERFEKELADAGLSEEELVRDFKAWRKARKR